jgi:hypothetical protein
MAAGQTQEQIQTKLAAHILQKPQKDNRSAKVCQQCEATTSTEYLASK